MDSPGDCPCLAVKTVCPSSLEDQDPSATHSIHPALLRMSHSTFPFLVKTTRQDFNKIVLWMFTKSSHYLFHGTAEIRDPQILKPLRKQTLPMQGTQWGKGEHVLPLLCNINPVNTTEGELLFSTRQEHFSVLQNLGNRQVNCKLNGYCLCQELLAKDPHYLFSKSCGCWYLRREDRGKRWARREKTSFLSDWVRKVYFPSQAVFIMTW